MTHMHYSKLTSILRAALSLFWNIFHRRWKKEFNVANPNKDLKESSNNMLTLVLLWKILSTQMFAVWSNRILVNKSSMVKPVEKLKKVLLQEMEMNCLWCSCLMLKLLISEKEILWRLIYCWKNCSKSRSSINCCFTYIGQTI